MSLDADIKVAEYMTELPKRELLEQKLHKNPQQIRQILNSTAIGGEKIAKENQYLLLDDINL